MKNILVLGAGLVAKPLITYLLDQPDYRVTVASRTVTKAEALVRGHKRGGATTLLIDDKKSLAKLVADADLVISLVPYIYHVTVARSCIKQRKHMVTTSYVSKSMADLDREARSSGITILNEIGLDPGIDHMSAMRIIDKAHERGGRVVSFESYCGGLPAPEANDNPFGYKFSWSPKGVVMAGRNSAQYLKHGETIKIAGEKLFDHHWPKHIETIGELEAYPNRDSISYIDLYNISETKTMLRGTLRYPGWCKTMKKIAELGLLDDTVKNIRGMRFSDFTARLIGVAESNNLAEDTARFLKVEEGSDVMKRLEWLGLLSNDPLPLEEGSGLDILAAQMSSKMPYRQNERDMVILHHDFVVEFRDEKKKEEVTSSLIDFGIPNGDSSMSRTVGLPAAIGAKLILEGKISAPGVRIPVERSIYEPVLTELERLGIICKEETRIQETRIL